VIDLKMHGENLKLMKTTCFGHKWP